VPISIIIQNQGHGSVTLRYAWLGTASSQESAPYHGATAIQVVQSLSVFVSANWNNMSYSWCGHTASVLTDMIDTHIMYGTSTEAVPSD